jgi:hypothetical protein
MATKQSRANGARIPLDCYASLAMKTPGQAESAHLSSHFDVNNVAKSNNCERIIIN